jgi:hypothetical protein
MVSMLLKMTEHETFLLSVIQIRIFYILDSGHSMRIFSSCTAVKHLPNARKIYKVCV